MRRVLVIATLAVAVALGALATPKVARADVYIGLPGFGLYLGDGRDYDRGRRHHYRRDYGPPPRYYRRHYGPPPRHWRKRHWRRHHGWRHGPRWRGSRHHWRRHDRRW